RSLVLDGHGPGQVLMAQDDRNSGGQSEARLEALVGGGAEMRCEIRLGFEWPFCELQVEMQGGDLDVSAFSRIRLWLQAEGPTRDHGPAQVRVFLRNFDPAYSSSGTLVDLKPQEIIFAPSAQPQPVDVRLSQFMVSSW